MAAFAYKGMRRGQRGEGMVAADSPAAAREKLRAEGWIVLEIKEGAAGGKGVADGDAGMFERLACRVFISKGQWEQSLRQLASLLHAGVPILTAFNAVSRHAEPLLARVYARVAKKLRQGHALKRCLAEEAPYIGRVPIGLIGVGEANGTLDEMLNYAATLMEQSRKVKGQITQAFAYPAFVCVGAMGMAYYMVRVVFPQVMKFIQKQGGKVQLPWPTRALIQINDFVGEYGIYLFATPFVLVSMFFLARHFKGSAEKVDRALLRIPLLGKAFLDHSNTMWCRTLGALLGSGVDIIAALELVQGAMGNQFYTLLFGKMREVVRQGRSLSDSMKKAGLARLCPMAMTMVAVSEESGGLDVSLQHVANYCQERLERRVALLSKMVEPAIFIVVGGMVGFVYFAFFLAMLAVTRSAR